MAPVDRTHTSSYSSCIATSLYRFPDKVRYWLKIAMFPPLLCITTPPPFCGKRLHIRDITQTQIYQDSSIKSFLSNNTDSRAGNGSIGHGSVGQIGHNFGRVTWVMGMLTHNPLPFTAYVFIFWICTNSLKGRIYRQTIFWIRIT